MLKNSERHIHVIKWNLSILYCIHIQVAKCCWILFLNMQKLKEICGMASTTNPFFLGVSYFYILYHTYESLNSDLFMRHLLLTTCQVMAVVRWTAEQSRVVFITGALVANIICVQQDTWLCTLILTMGTYPIFIVMVKIIYKWCQLYKAFIILFIIIHYDKGLPYLSLLAPSIHIVLLLLLDHNKLFAKIT